MANLKHPIIHNRLNVSFHGLPEFILEGTTHEKGEDGALKVTFALRPPTDEEIRRRKRRERKAFALAYGSLFGLLALGIGAWFLVDHFYPLGPPL